MRRTGRSQGDGGRLRPDQQGQSVDQEVRTFKTTTSGLLDLSEWLSEKGCTHAVMEATGVYWKPVWHILSDGDFALVLANAAHVKNVPGRKTDVNDATWLADLLAHGLIRGSFVPDRRDAGAARPAAHPQATGARAGQPCQRLQKTLEDANIKLDSAISDITGRQRPGDDPGADRRRDRSRRLGRAWRTGGSEPRPRPCARRCAAG